jgi:hypothetical protein
LVSEWVREFGMIRVCDRVYEQGLWEEEVWVGVWDEMAGGASSSSSEFEWGEKVAGLENSYERMCFRGVWYSLYDCVHVRSLAEEPHAGKIMRLYEEDGNRKMRVRWFLRSYELPFGVSKDLSVKSKKELFIAQGSVKGVENVNLVVRLRSGVYVLDSTFYSLLSLFHLPLRVVSLHAF